MAIKTLEQAMKVIKARNVRITELEAALEAAKSRGGGLRSSGIDDQYTAMESPELRALIIKRSGDPDEIARGYHSRARSIKMREWLRENGPKKTKAAPAPVKTKVKAAPEPVARKKRPAPAPEPVVAKKRKLKVVEAPPAKKKRVRGM